MITRMLAGVGPTGRPLFLKMVYHGPKAMEELVAFNRHLIVGILGGSAGTTRDAFQLLHDAQKYGAKVALFGRKINNAENQLAFVHFLRLIVEGCLGPEDAVKAYHAVLVKLGLKPKRSLDDDLRLTDQSMSYSEGSRARIAVPGSPRAIAATAPVSARPVSSGAAASSNGKAACPCQSEPAAVSQNGAGGHCSCQRPAVTESNSAVSRHRGISPNGQAQPSHGRPDFARMTSAERLAYHRERLGLGR